MELSCIRHTLLPNTTKLFADFLYHPERVARFYPHLPLDIDQLRRSAQHMCFPADQRRALIQALSIQNAGNPLLEKLAQPDTVAIVTGQQVGLFSGPPFSIYKALTAIRLAQDLSGQGIPAVPVFWLATEDHDLHEVDHAWFFDAQHQPVLLQASAPAGTNRPVGTIPIDRVPLDELKTVLQGLPYADEAFELAREAYQPGRTFGEAFAALLDGMLAGLPILRVDPMLPAFRNLAAPLLQDAVLRAPELTPHLLQRNHDLTEAGYHAQVHVEDQTALFFLLEKGQRLALKRSNGDYLLGSRKIPASELAQRANELSPNALLRPVVQDSMIPTLAYCGGPAELAYFAQSEVLYSKLLGRQPAAISRASFTVLTAHERKRIDRYRLELTDFFNGEQSLLEKVGRVLVDPQMEKRVRGARSAAVEGLAEMTGLMGNFDLSIRKAIEKSRRKIEYQFDRIERRVGREALARQQRGEQDVKSLYNVVFPRHRLQERVYSTLALIAEHGPDFAARVYDSVSLDCPDHRILTF